MTTAILATYLYKQRRYPLWAFVATLLIVAAWLGLRWPHHSLWYDEALSAWVASGPLDRLIHWCTQVDIQVPLHYIVLRAWMALLGESEFALHLLSAFCGLLAVAGLFALTRRLTRMTSSATIAAILAALLLGLSPGFLWVAFEVRAYALALALFAWASVFLVECLTLAPRRWVLGVYCALVLAMLYTHYTGIGALAAHGLIALWVIGSRRSGALARRMIGVGLVIGLGFAPWLPVLLSRGAADRSFYSGAILPDQTLGVLLSFKWLARDDFKWLTPDNTLSPLAPLVAGGALVLFVGIAAWLWQRRPALPVIYGLCLGLLPALTLAVIVLFKPKLAGRYAWPAWVGLDLLLALGIVALTSPLNAAKALKVFPPLSSWFDVLIGGVGGEVKPFILALIFLAIPWLTGQTGHPPDSDFRGVFAYIRDHWQPDDLVLLRDGTLFPAAEYYHSPQPYLGLPAAYLTDATQILQAAEAAPILAKQSNTIRGVWIVSWQGNVMDPENVSAGLLETIGEQQPVQSAFGDVGLEYFVLDAPLSTLNVPAFSPAPLLTVPGGPTLDSARLLNGETIEPGVSIIAQTWWWRGDPVQIDTRVSIRLVRPDGRTLAQSDQPPAGWFYFPDHWPSHTLILGRYEMPVPLGVSGPVVMKLIVYSAANNITPAEVTIGTVQVR